MTMSKWVQEQTERALKTADMILKESDRGCAVCSAAILSERLEYLLRSVMRSDARPRKKVVDPLFEGFGPLAGFFARIQVAYAFRLIPDDVRDQLDIIRRLRNEFAHDQGPIDFDDPRCASKVSSLIGPDEIRGANRVATTTKLNMTGPYGQKLLRRLAFSLRVSKLGGTLEACAFHPRALGKLHARQRGWRTSAKRDQ